jgi:hypothetical protein
LGALSFREDKDDRLTQPDTAEPSERLRIGGATSSSSESRAGGSTARASTSFHPRRVAPNDLLGDEGTRDPLEVVGSLVHQRHD